jgi:Holliday junction DNA helicase RuvA
MNLGYKEPQVRKALAGLDASGGLGVEELLKQALKILMK